MKPTDSLKSKTSTMDDEIMNQQEPTQHQTLTMDILAERISFVDESLRQQTAHAVNCMLTARNWFIGYYIVEFEQLGEDRAQYGEQLLKQLAKKINRKGMEWRRLYEFRTFYTVYPQLKDEIICFLRSQWNGNRDGSPIRLAERIGEPSQFPPKKLQSLTAILQSIDKQGNIILQPLAAISSESWQTSPERLFHRINYTCLQILSEIKEPLKRAFYEHELIQGCWTKRELDRQISSLYYERSALSKDKVALQRYVQQGTQTLPVKYVVRDPMTLEFLGIPPETVYTETKLETAILNNIQKFLLELGQGFCFEARQKRVLIDHDYFKADLVFYNRLLHCHYIVDLKIDRYRHEYGSQLNTYKNYYRHEMMQPGDNPPIGLLLCTDYSETLVQYSTEGLEDIYVGKYMLQLPSEESIKQYLIDTMPPEEVFKEKDSKQEGDGDIVK